MARGARGEAILEMDGQQYPVLFTNRAIYDLEQALNTNVLALLQQAQAGNIGMNAIAHMVAIGMEHSRRDRHDSRKPYTLADAFELLDGLGFAQVTSQVVPAFVDVLTYNTEKADSPPA